MLDSLDTFCTVKDDIDDDKDGDNHKLGNLDGQDFEPQDEIPQFIYEEGSGRDTQTLIPRLLTGLNRWDANLQRLSQVPTPART